MDQYPKMLTRKTPNGAIVPVTYPPGHEKQGQTVIFENEAEETAYFKPKPKAKVKAKAKAKAKTKR